MEEVQVKKWKPRTPDPNESLEDAAMYDQLHSIDFFQAESFKLGLLLGLEIAN